MSKCALFVPTQIDCNVKKLTQSFLANVLKILRFCKEVIGTLFTSKFFPTLFTSLTTD